MNSIKIIGLLLMFFSFPVDGSCQLWKQYADSAKVYSTQKNTEKAIEFYFKEREDLPKDSANTQTQVEICDSLGISFYRKHEYKDAEKFYLEANRLLEKLNGSNNIDYASSCRDLAGLYKTIGKFEKAESLYVTTMQIQEKILGKLNLSYAKTCSSLGNLYDQIGQNEKAESMYLEAMQIQEKVIGKENTDYANTCVGLAQIYDAMGNFQKAEAFYLEAKQIRERVEGKEHSDYAYTCMGLAYLYFDIGQYEKSESLFLEAKKIEERLSEAGDLTYASTCVGLANLYQYLEQLDKAEPLYLKAKQIIAMVLGKQHPGYGSLCNDLGLLYRKMGEFGKSESLFREAMQIYVEGVGKANHDYANSCGNLGSVYEDMGQYKKAEPLLLESKEILANILGKEHPDYAGACNTLASLYYEMGECGKAATLFRQGMLILEKAGEKESPDYASAADFLAMVYSSLGQYAVAEPLYLDAKEIRGKILGTHNPDYGSSCTDLANFYWKLQRPLQAEREFKESFIISAYNLFNVFQFTNEEEKAAYIKNISGEDNTGYSFFYSEKIKSSLPYSLALFHRNLILSSSQGLRDEILSSDDSSLINKYNDWLGLKKYLAMLYSMPVNDRKEDPAKIEEKADEEEKELTRLSSGFRKQQQRVEWKDIQKRLQPDEVSIEFVAFHYYNGSKFTDSTYYIALVLREDDSLPELVKLFEKRKLDALLRKSEGRTAEEKIHSLYTNTPKLYDLVWKPIEKYLKGIRKVYFAPAGQLYKISFAGIPINSKKVLSDKYQLVQLNTTANITDSGQSTIYAGDKIQLYGGIEYNADSATLEKAAYAYRQPNENSRSLPGDLKRGVGFQYLPGTFQEVEAIKELGDAKKETMSVLTGADATEESVKSQNGKVSPSVLHFATHGFFFPDPREVKANLNHRKFNANEAPFKQSDNPLFRSGLLFAGANNAWKGKPIEGIDDGVLTSYEVSNMYLPNTKLVVLSACNTALGDIEGSEGVYGLQRAFKMAGAQYLVMSLWKVLDAETSEFMQIFYKNLFTEQTINDAFSNAQQAMKNKYRSEPYKWAAWILVK